MIRVQQLTNDSPTQVIFYRDLGGSSLVLMMTDIYALIGGRLRHSLELKSHEGVFATAEPYQETSEVRTGDRRIVIHTVWEKPMGSPHRHTCRVLAWDVRAMAFVAATKDTDTYCDAKTGRPKEEMTNGSGLFSAPPYVVLQ